MAAELVGGAFLQAAFQVAFERLASSDIRGYFRGRKAIDALLKKLHITLISVNQVLDDAEERQYSNSNVKKWVDELKHVVFLADDLLDEIAYEATRQKLEVESQTATSKVRGFFTSSVNQFDKEIEGRIEEVFEDLEFLAKQKDVLGLKESGCGGGSTEVGVGGKISNRLPSTSLVDESKIYGRDGDKEEIIKILLSDLNEKVSVTSILGMGGMGKTTLAQLVYNDKRVKDQFELKAWVCVSDEFYVQRITKTILSALGCSITGNEDLNQLQLKLREIVIEKKLLLVLDDVWNEDSTNWEALQVPFLCVASGSKILVTTRNERVALVMGSVRMHHLQLLKAEDAWKLFARHAFYGKDDDTCTNLESIGRRIVEKCKGLPLAIKTLGGLLHTKFSQQHWNKILESDIWQLSSDDSNIIPALRLSYHHLPSHLKRCFAFCSIFPKDYGINKHLLIKMWMAEGLLHCHQGNKSLEELGEEFFIDLESRFFFQSWSKHLFVMHDLINDLAKSVSGDYCVRIDGGKIPDCPTNARYFSYSVTFDDDDKILEPIYDCRQLRSFVKLEIWPGVNVIPNFLLRFNYLRVFSLKRCKNIIELVNDISNLKHLRFLDLSGTPLRRLPDSICVLHNLQTLILNCCYDLVELPMDMHKLINLRNLDLSDTRINKLPNSICKLLNLHSVSLRFCAFLAELPANFHQLINLRHLDLVGTHIREMPQHIRRLKHLQYLPMFFVGKQSGSNIKELGEVSNLEGTLSISQLENVNNVMDAGEANLRGKKCLHKLELKWNENHDGSQNERRVLEALQPHINLKELTIINYGGTRFVGWFDALCLPNLVSLQLTGCNYCFCLPPLGQLPSLKNLSISCFEGIKEIGTEFYGNKSLGVGFKSLEFLEFVDMGEWEEWMHPDDECFPCLQHLSLESCPRLTNSLPPCLASLKSLHISECQQLEPPLPKVVAMTNSCIPRSGVEECWLELIMFTFPDLEKLCLDNCPKFISFSTCQLSAPKLGYLSISNISYQSPHSASANTQTQLLPTYHSLWFKNCPLLRSLVLHNCPHLESFHMNRALPSCLVNLSIRRCPKLVHSRNDWGLHQLHSLQQFEISDDFENVESFPEEALLPPNLRTLILADCPHLKTVNYKGLLHLTSLRSLDIKHCPSLQFLPEQGLPISLSCLGIYGNSPLLKQRYQKEIGQDRPKISHIPNVHIS